MKGDRFNASQLSANTDGLKLNHLTRNYTHLLTGYCGDESFLNKIADIVDDLKAANPNLVYRKHLFIESIEKKSSLIEDLI